MAERQNGKQTIPRELQCWHTTSRQREELLNTATQPWGWAPWEHPPAKHTPPPHKRQLQWQLWALEYPQVPPPKCRPIHPHHLEIGLAIKTRGSDITGPINAARGQKYQVTGEGLICFHFYYVSNLEERKCLHEKPSQLLLDGYGFSFSQSLEEITLAKREIRVQEVHRSPSITPQPNGSVQPSTNTEHPRGTVSIYFSATSWQSKRLYLSEVRCYKLTSKLSVLSWCPWDSWK